MLRKIIEEQHFLPSIVKDLSKNNDFAKSVHLSIDVVLYILRKP